jgi:hypothetical protein
MRLGNSVSGNFRVYHGTDAKFERFNMDFAARPNMSGNGHLGVWVAAAYNVGKVFGERCLIVHMRVDKAYRMPLSELAEMNRHCQKQAGEDPEKLAAYERVYYSQVREKLLAEGFDCIYVEESDGRVEMGIALDPGKLVIARVMHAAA